MEPQIEQPVIKPRAKRNPNFDYNEYAKQYKISHRDENLEYAKNYYKENIEYFRNYYQQKKHCSICNRDYSLTHYARHLKSKKHLNKLEQSYSSDDSLTVTEPMTE